MATKILIPTPLRAYTDGSAAVEAQGGTVDEVLRDLITRFAQLQPHLYGESGALRSYVNIYLNDDDVRYLQKGKTPVKESDTISIIPSIAGGAGAMAPAEHAPHAALPELSREELLRYDRHLIMPEIGLEGQQRLKASKVLLIGAGGLGSPAALYLAAAGVGTIGIVEFDTVDVTNLQRQVLHGTSDVGRPKLDSARETIREINPHVEVRGHPVRLTSENALEIIRHYDLVVDGTDNFPTRYLVNDACVLLGKPYIYGSIFRFEGQVTVFDARRGPCYRCLYATPPPPGLVPGCAEGGVLGVLPGIIGSLQALEAIKMLAGIGEPLIGRLLLFDALQLRFRELKLRKDPACPICGEHRTIHELIDYEEFCGIPASPAERPGIRREEEITVEELQQRLQKGEKPLLIDVREPHEREIASIGGRLIPLRSLPKRVTELDPSREVIVYCRTGERSQRAVEFLRTRGYRRARNLIGGIRAWSEKIDRSVPRY